jgi:hypothetical protein
VPVSQGKQKLLVSTNPRLMVLIILACLAWLNQYFVILKNKNCFKKIYILIHFKTKTTFKSNLFKAYHFTVATSTNSDATGQSAHPALPTLLPIEIIIF